MAWHLAGAPLWLAACFQPRLCVCHLPAPAVTRLRPLDDALPDGLSIITYAAMASPVLSPFIPLYKVCDEWQARQPRL